jgi:hypothetical protein
MFFIIYIVIYFSPPRIEDCYSSVSVFSVPADGNAETDAANPNHVLLLDCFIIANQHDSYSLITGDCMGGATLSHSGGYAASCRSGGFNPSDKE